MSSPCDMDLADDGLRDVAALYHHAAPTASSLLQTPVSSGKGMRMHGSDEEYALGILVFAGMVVCLSVLASLTAFVLYSRSHQLITQTLYTCPFSKTSQSGINSLVQSPMLYDSIGNPRIGGCGGHNTMMQQQQQQQEPNSQPVPSTNRRFQLHRGLSTLFGVTSIERSAIVEDVDACEVMINMDALMRHQNEKHWRNMNIEQTSEEIFV